MKRRKFSLGRMDGIQGRFLTYTLMVLMLALMLSGLCVGIVMHRTIRQSSLEQYFYANDRISMRLKEQYEKSDALMKRCIANPEFQNSLLNREATLTEKQFLEQFLAYLDMDYLQNYFYIDNKGNIYGKPYQTLSYQEFLQSGFTRYLGEEYSSTKWFIEEDRLFRTEELSLFIGRYIRNMDYAHEPGILLLKMDAEFFDTLLSEVRESECCYLFLDQNGQPFFAKAGKCGLVELSEKWMEDVAASIQKNETQSNAGQTAGYLEQGTVRCKAEGMPGTAIYTRQEDTGFFVVTFLPDRILNTPVIRMLLILLVVYIAAVLFACILSIYFSERFTEPIRQINNAMQGFDAGDKEEKLELHTNTELDSIGNSFNKMIGDIRRLLVRIREQERELYDSELNSLMYQINPHFLYNTLDTIYMLARINHEETTMKMIQALSKFLKVSLSKGSGVISVEDELEHVKSYMDIQKIRNNDLFTYEVHCEKKLLKRQVLKLILQPLVENSIKHGFCEIYEGGIIRIDVEEEENNLIFRVWNNGVPMSGEDREKILQMGQCDYQKIYGFFQDREGGYGVSNVMGRLRLKYGAKMQYYYEYKDGGTLCVIKLPQEVG